MDFSRQIVERDWKKWGRHLPFQYFPETAIGAVVTKNANLVLVVVGRDEKRKSLNVIPVDVSNQQTQIDRPGTEFNATVGVSYEEFDFQTFKIAPLLQFIGSYRLTDGGPQANPDGSGYERLLISPGFRFNVSNVRVNANVALPVYQHVNGNQLISPALFKLSVSYSF